MTESVYALLRNLTSPVVAITTSAGGRRNGFIVNSAQRASLVPSIPRISIYVSKTNFSHDLIYSSGVFGLHLLRNDQWDLIYHLGLQSGRSTHKLSVIETTDGVTGCPLLTDAIAAFECKVVNAMDTGASTFFLGDVVNVVEGTPGQVMTSDYFRENMNLERRWQYENNLRAAQVQLEALARTVDSSKVWPGASAAP